MEDTFKKLEFSNITEIPLGKVRKGDIRSNAINWYQDSIQRIVEFYLSNPPSNII